MPPGPAADGRRALVTATTVILPVKPFSKAKSRLAPALGPAERAEVARRMARRVLEAVRAAGLTALVVTADPEARILAAEAGARWVDEEDARGLNAAVLLGLDEAAALGAAAALVLPADLPNIAPADVAAASRRPGADGVVIAPSRGDGGTNGLCLPLPAPLKPAYGPDSFARHCAAALEAGAGVKVIRRPGLEVDADRPGDLQA